MARRSPVRRLASPREAMRRRWFDGQAWPSSRRPRGRSLPVRWSGHAVESGPARRRAPHGPAPVAGGRAPRQRRVAAAPCGGGGRRLTWPSASWRSIPPARVRTSAGAPRRSTSWWAPTGGLARPPHLPGHRTPPPPHHGRGAGSRPASRRCRALHAGPLRYMWLFPGATTWASDLRPAASMPTRDMIGRLEARSRARSPPYTTPTRSGMPTPSPRRRRPPSILELSGERGALVGDAAGVADP